MGLVDSRAILVPLLRDEPDFSALTSPEKWQQIQRVASARCVGALVAFAVRGHASGAQRVWCDKVLTQSWARHDAAIRHLDWVLQQLQESNIQVLVLKGPILGRRHFEPPFLRRPSGDIDLAVRACDLERAANALIARGYEPADTLEEACRTSHHLVMYIAGRPRVELHTRLSHDARGIPVDRFFGRCAQHQLPTGRIASILAPADELLGLLLHFASDRFSSFFHLYELRRVWRSAAADVKKEVLATAVAHRFSATLWLTELAFQIYWSERFLPEDAEVPKTWLQGRFNAALLHRMEANIHASLDRPLGVRLEGRWLDLHATDSPVDALRALGLLWWVAWREVLKGRWGTLYKSGGRRVTTRPEAQPTESIKTASSN